MYTRNYIQHLLLLFFHPIPGYCLLAAELAVAVFSSQNAIQSETPQMKFCSLGAIIISSWLICTQRVHLGLSASGHYRGVS